MIIIGVDPGTLITGYGIIESRNGTVRAIAYDAIKNNSSKSMPLRLQNIFESLCDVIERFHPDEFAIETAFYGKNAQSALKLGHARGVAMLAAVIQEIPVGEYSPREVKKAIVGKGTASKEQVQYMVKSILCIREKIMVVDSSDALAVALCHSYCTQNVFTNLHSRIKNNSWKYFIEENPGRIVKIK